MRVLALSSNYEPVGTISWYKAVSLLLSDKISILEEYDQIVRSPSVSMKIPSVIVFKTNKFKKINSVRFSRKNVWLRDEGKCQYCSRAINSNEFTIDHIQPKCDGGKSTWENVVVSCYKCNQKKGQSSLKDSGLKLLKQPKKPTSLPFISELVNYYKIGMHPTWEFWLNR
jgi:5-methylcytosine-specific restriction endonuclease McrA